ncbi:ABC transporter permease [Aquamicrobium sp. LC103]|uniref:ABC transporter permease n=1 Tax=Aquamicrobium sp. LC103 TaxID=1120658 RepID=UPI00063EC141|nr:ABC transporter permease [Aquamicrobium sp. LC103]TKT74382.1 ABC transporter permease [Aquamicrobium sp. LC103]
MSELSAAGPAASPDGDTIWTERTSLGSAVPRWVSMLILLVGFLGLWQLVTSAGIVSPLILPSPAATIVDLGFVGRSLLSGSYMLAAFWVTAQEVIWGFVVALAIGVSLGILVGETSIGERAVMPYIVAIDTMPKLAFAPLFVAWLGFGISSKVALAAFISVFPIVVGTAAGLHAADENARMLFKSIGASRLQTLLKLKIPTGLPQFFTGLKIAAISVVSGAIAGEFLGGGRGFGELIRVAAAQLDTPRVFSLIIYLSFLGLLMFGMVSWMQYKFVFWHRTSGDIASRAGK